MHPGVGDLSPAGPGLMETTMTTETLPIVSDDPEIQAMYERVRGNGESHNFAKICAFRRGPGLSTDTTFMAGVGTIAQQCGDDDKEVDRLISAAKKLGHTPNRTDLYNPTLARCLGDPWAFVPAANPKAHIKKVCEMRGKDCEGMVNYTAPERVEEPVKGKKLSNRLVNEELRKRVKEDPGLPTRKGAVANAKQEIIDKHGFSLE